VICSHALSASEPGLSANPVTLTTTDFAVTASKSCARTNAAGTAQPDILLGEVGTRDLSDWVGFEIS
jgi:hypothetical protein